MAFQFIFVLMKKRFIKISSLLMALLVLLSTMSWSVEKHLCMGRVMDVAFFHDAQGCPMEEAMASLEESMPEMDCCDDESFTLKGQDNLKCSWDEIDLQAPQFVVEKPFEFLALSIAATTKSFVNNRYPPPLLVFDLQELHQTYLI